MPEERPKLRPKIRPKLRPKSIEEEVVNLLSKGPLSKAEIAELLGHQRISGGSRLPHFRLNPLGESQFWALHFINFPNSLIPNHPKCIVNLLCNFILF